MEGASGAQYAGTAAYNQVRQARPLEYARRKVLTPVPGYPGGQGQQPSGGVGRVWLITSTTGRYGLVRRGVPPNPGRRYDRSG